MGWYAVDPPLLTDAVGRLREVAREAAAAAEGLRSALDLLAGSAGDSAVAAAAAEAGTGWQRAGTGWASAVSSLAEAIAQAAAEYAAVDAETAR